MKFEQYMDNLKREFSRYGFTAAPMNDDNIWTCWVYELSIDQAYRIGCDVNAGFDFLDSLKEEV